MFLVAFEKNPDLLRSVEMRIYHRSFIIYPSLVMSITL